MWKKVMTNLPKVAVYKSTSEFSQTGLIPMQKVFLHFHHSTSPPPPKIRNTPEDSECWVVELDSNFSLGFVCFSDPECWVVILSAGWDGRGHIRQSIQQAEALN
jgi:hypothetical protein